MTDADPRYPVPDAGGAPPASDGRPYTSGSTGLADGEWHRLHPATPLLKGGIALIAIAGVIIANARERIIDSFIGAGEYSGDPVDWIIGEGLLGWALLVTGAVLLIVVAGFYLSWRMHSFRITDEFVEVRSGILFRTNRRARLDRIQGINVVRPFIPRIFGAAKLEVNQAGDDANVQLSYLHSKQADDLRRDILLLASGTRRAAERSTAAAANGGVIGERISEFLAPELDPDAAPPESVVQLNPGRLAGSLALSDISIAIVAMLIAVGVSAFITGEFLLLVGFVPGLLALGGVLVSRFTKSLRYSIAGTEDGVRVGFGLLSTSNETLPPGRIHSIQISQTLLWRPFDWWHIKVNRASRSSTKGAAGQENTTILPVGDRLDVARVLALIAPEVGDHEHIMRGLTSRGDDEGWVNSPVRAQALRWFSRRRNGFTLVPGGVVIRKGAIWRTLIIVPQPRVQSTSMRQGPVLRSLRLGALHVHTVAGPITPSLGAMDMDELGTAFDEIAARTVEAAASDRSHRWRSESMVAVEEPLTQPLAQHSPEQLRQPEQGAPFQQPATDMPPQQAATEFDTGSREHSQ
ncbi:PH domain-containing protein [Ruicaihuangia caeni]|uniref:PH domain-containing protein n=1 Tax=Ruicaihuangia caeni TaxID=3042517 RepID=UPI00338E9BE3